MTNIKNKYKNTNVTKNKLLKGLKKLLKVNAVSHKLVSHDSVLNYLIF